MTSQTGSQQPVVLLIGKEEADDYCSFKQWLDENEFVTREANDIFQVIEEISDFTVRRCPDVILLEAETDSHGFIEKVFQNSTESNRIEVMPFVETGDRAQSSTANLSRLKARFNEMLPNLSRAA